MTPVQIDCFLSTADCGSIAGAAKELFLSVQVVSQHIRNLEKELNCRLFQRSVNGMTVTAQGERLQDFALRQRAKYSATIKGIRDMYTGLSMGIRIGLTEYVDSVGEISDGIVSFAKAQGGTDVTCVQYSNRDIMWRLTEGVIDVALICDNQLAIGGDFEFMRFAQEDLCLYVTDPSFSAESDVLNETLVRQLRSAVHYSAPYGPWSQDEWPEISSRMCASLGLSFDKLIPMPNFRSVIACADMLPAAIVSDKRFGYLHDRSDLLCFSLNQKSYLSAVWNKWNENPLVTVFAEHMKRYYAPESGILTEDP